MKARIAIALVLGGVILLVLLVALRQPYLAQQTLPDGTVLTLVTVKAGSKHESPFATTRQKLTARLPANWQSRLKMWPRRAETIRIQVYPKWGEPMFFPKYRNEMIAEFRVKNPGRDKK